MCVKRKRYIYHITNILSNLLAITHLSSTHPSITMKKLSECGRQLAAAEVPLPDGIIAGYLLINYHQ